MVEKLTLTLSLPNGGFRLEEGGTLPRIDVAYESCGLVKPENDNVVFICHALTGDAHVAGRYEGEDHSTGWWNDIVGPGKAIDTNRFRVVCANVLGGCKGTTGPSSINPSTGKPWGSAFPRFTIGDTVEVYRALLRELGITRLAALVGGSFGGVQVLEWITAHPNEVDKAIMIASSAALNAQALAFNIVGRYAITLDPHWNGGDYYDKPFEERPNVGLAQARQVAHISYCSLDMLNSRFGRKLQDNWVANPPEWQVAHAGKFGTLFSIESYLGYQAKKFITRFDANSYLQITHSLDRYDAAVKYGSLDNVCDRITSKLMLVSLSGDWLFSEAQSRAIAAAMLRRGKNVVYSHLDIKVGHDGFLTHTKELGRLMGAFLSPTAIEVPAEKRRKHAPIVDMIKPGSRVMDIGCGTGSLLTLLRDKRVTGAGIDIDFERIVPAVGRGLNVLYEDADGELALLPDNGYDVAVLSETLQTVKKPREILVKILGKAKEAIVTIPNFAAIGIRLHLLLTGRMPVGSELPFEWYDTPNTHFFTFDDFKALCAKEGIAIKSVCAESSTWYGKLFLALGFTNLGADRVICRLARA